MLYRLLHWIGHFRLRCFDEYDKQFEKDNHSLPKLFNKLFHPKGKRTQRDNLLYIPKAPVVISVSQDSDRNDKTAAASPAETAPADDNFFTWEEMEHAFDAIDTSRSKSFLSHGFDLPDWEHVDGKVVLEVMGLVLKDRKNQKGETIGLEIDTEEVRKRPNSILRLFDRLEFSKQKYRSLRSMHEQIELFRPPAEDEQRTPASRHLARSLSGDIHDDDESVKRERYLKYVEKFDEMNSELQQAAVEYKEKQAAVSEYQQQIQKLEQDLQSKVAERDQERSRALLDHYHQSLNLPDELFSPEAPQRLCRMESNPGLRQRGTSDIDVRHRDGIQAVEGELEQQKAAEHTASSEEKEFEHQVRVTQAKRLALLKSKIIPRLKQKWLEHLDSPTTADFSAPYYAAVIPILNTTKTWPQILLCMALYHLNPDIIIYFLAPDSCKTAIDEVVSTVLSWFLS